MQHEGTHMPAALQGLALTLLLAWITACACTDQPQAQATGTVTSYTLPGIERATSEADLAELLRCAACGMHIHS